MKHELDISVVVPVYNAELSLDELVQRIHSVMNENKFSFEIILVDDASRDRSWKKIEDIKQQYPQTVNGIRLLANVGQHVSVLCGFNFVRGALVITMDDDLQHAPEDIPKLVAAQKENRSEVVYGVFGSKKHGVIRSTGSLVLRKTARSYSKTIGDGSSFRCFNRELVDKIKSHFQSFVFIDEIIYWYTYDISTVELEHYPSKKKRSGYSLFGLFGLLSNLLINYTAIPLRLMTYGGLFMSFCSFMAGIYFIIKRVWFKVEVPGFTATIVVVLFSTSLILICFGIIGQYLYRLYHMQLGKPAFQIKDRT